MVTRTKIILLTLSLLAPSAFAAVSASVDRDHVDANESFHLTIESDDVRSLAPDLMPLQDDFDVMGQNQTQSTSIVNGRISQTQSWNFSLMPKREGELTVPAIRVGSESTDPITITVNPADPLAANGSDVFVTAEIDRSESWVQAQIVYTIRIFTAVAQRQPRLDEPEIEGGEVLIRQLGDDTNYESVIDGRNYAVIERRYALFPQASGEYKINEVRYSARIWERSRLSSRKMFRSNDISLTVQPIPDPPPGFPDAAWLPAIEVHLDERWNPADRGVAAGEPATRTIKMSAIGLLANQLPPIPELAGAGLRIYPDQPDLQTTDSPDGVVGHRTERFAIIAAAAGEYTLPELKVPWWNVNTGSWAIATLSSASLTTGSPLQSPGVAEPAVLQSGSADLAPEPLASSVWRTVSVGLAAGWGATIALWAWTRRTPRKSKTRSYTVPGYRRTRRLVREIRAAANQNEPRQTSAKLLEWAELNWPDAPPKSLVELAALLPGPLAAQLKNLHGALYGPSPSDQWSGQQLAQALRHLETVGATAQKANTDGLAPLSP